MSEDEQSKVWIKCYCMKCKSMIEVKNMGFSFSNLTLTFYLECGHTDTYNMGAKK